MIMASALALLLMTEQPSPVTAKVLWDYKTGG